MHFLSPLPLLETRQAVAVQHDGASSMPGWTKNTHFSTPGMYVFLSPFYSTSPPHNSVENNHIEKKLVLRNIYKKVKVLLIYQPRARFPSLCLGSWNAIFDFDPRNNHTSGENDCFGKKLNVS